MEKTIDNLYDAKARKKERKEIEINCNVDTYNFAGRLRVGDHGKYAVLLGVLAIMFGPSRAESLCQRMTPRQ